MTKGGMYVNGQFPFTDQIVLHTSDILTVLSWWSSTQLKVVWLKSQQPDFTQFMNNPKSEALKIYKFWLKEGIQLHRTRYCFNAQYNVSRVKKNTDPLAFSSNLLYWMYSCHNPLILRTCTLLLLHDNTWYSVDRHTIYTKY